MKTKMVFLSGALSLLNKSQLRRLPSVLAAESSFGLSTRRASLSIFSIPRGGSSAEIPQNFTSSAKPEDIEYVTLSEPAKGSPFHFAFPVHDLDLAKKFYGEVLGCKGK